MLMSKNSKFARPQFTEKRHQTILVRLKKPIRELKGILEELDGVIIRLAAIAFLLTAVVKLLAAH